VATVPLIPAENLRLLEVREDVAALKADALGLKASHERLERDFAKLADKLDQLSEKFDRQNEKFNEKFDKQNEKFDRQNEKFDKQNEKIEQIRGDLRDVQTTLKIVISILAPIGLIVVTQFAALIFQRVQLVPTPIAVAQPAPAVQQAFGLSAEDVQKLKKLLDSQPSPKPR
jgi:predicted RNase H-like nuclease (RuvC/YqgF family)